MAPRTFRAQQAATALRARWRPTDSVADAAGEPPAQRDACGGTAEPRAAAAAAQPPPPPASQPVTLQALLTAAAAASCAANAPCSPFERATNTCFVVSSLTLLASLEGFAAAPCAATGTSCALIQQLRPTAASNSLLACTKETRRRPATQKNDGDKATQTSEPATERPRSGARSAARSAPPDVMPTAADNAHRRRQRPPPRPSLLQARPPSPSPPPTRPLRGRGARHATVPDAEPAAARSGRGARHATVPDAEQRTIPAATPKPAASHRDSAKITGRGVERAQRSERSERSGASGAEPTINAQACCRMRAPSEHNTRDVWKQTSVSSHTQRPRTGAKAPPARPLLILLRQTSKFGAKARTPLM
jgi:hypothetical protein